MKTNNLLKDLFDLTFADSIFGNSKKPCGEISTGVSGISVFPASAPEKKKVKKVTPIYFWGRDTIIGVYNSYVDGLDIETISALFEITKDDVNVIIDSINC